MCWTTRLMTSRYPGISVLWWGAVSFLLFLFLGGSPLWAQTTIYTWTDEEGVVHYSNSVVPPRHLNNATTMAMPPRSSTRPFSSQESQSIPLVILNNSTFA
jgi:hypothetical protein